MGDIGHRVVLRVRRVGPGGKGVNVEYLLTTLSKTKGFLYYCSIIASAASVAKRALMINACKYREE